MNKREILKNIRVFVLDLDGTFYLGDSLLPGSLRFAERVRETGRKLLFFTNNSSKPAALYIDKIGRMGLTIGRDDIVTSGDVTMDYLNRFHKGNRVYLLGTQSLREEFSSNGIRVLDEDMDAAPDGTTADVVVAAFDTELTYRKLERACTHIRNGAVFLATHEDINCPVENGFVPDCGAFCAAISLSTGRHPKYLGKPHKETVNKIITQTGISREGLAFVGDRLYTDVACGVNNGAAGLLVLSGETKEGDIAVSPVRPDAVFGGLGDIADLL